LLGQAIIALVVPHEQQLLTSLILKKKCQSHLPSYMVPSLIEMQTEQLPRNTNGKIDRKSLQANMCSLFDEVQK